MIKYDKDGELVMKRIEFNIGNRNCILYLGKDSEYVLIQPVDENDIDVLDEEVRYIRENTDREFSLIAFKVENWNDELTPWKAPQPFGKGSFGNGASETLEFIEGELLPSLVEYIGKRDGSKKYILGGYSLAGLFSLWCGYNTVYFDAVAAVSPSVWYKDWIEYVEKNEAVTQVIYLSLGDKEEHTRNQIMSKVGINMKMQYEILLNEGKIKNTVLEWNEGNHFKETGIRMAKGFLWCIRNS